MAPHRAYSVSERKVASGKTKANSRSTSAATSSSKIKAVGGLSFTASPPQQKRLSFEPASRELAKKKVKIEEPVSRCKGKARAVEDDLQSERDSRQQKRDLWSIAYAPSSRSDLAVHPRKVKDVQAWFRDALDGPVSLKKLRRLLVLTGPTGSAKTETIRQLSSPSELDFDIIEWKNDTTARSGESLADGEDFASIGGRFREFFSRSTRFRKLTLSGQPSSSEDTSLSSRARSSQVSSSAASPKRSRRIILLEDLPNLSHPTTLQIFQEMIATQLSLPLSPEGDHIPICVIISDVTGSSGGLPEDGSLSDGRLGREMDWMRPRCLLGDELTGNPSWLEIKFNPVAPTLIRKALKNTLEQADGANISNSKGYRSVKAADGFLSSLIDVVAEVSNGDIRSAIDTLQHVYIAFQREPKKFSALNDVKSKKSDKRSKEAARGLLTSLGVVGKDSSLDLFHALGKILWNKRIGDPDDDHDGDESGVAVEAEVDPLPHHLQHLSRRKSKVDVKGLAHSSIDPSALQLFNHQNFLSFSNEIEDCESILEAFSFVDSQVKVRESGVEGYATQALSDHYSFLITTHATLLHLPSPVPRKGQRPVKPAFFEATARSKAQRATLEDVKRSMRWDLRSSKEVQEEFVPLVGKIVGTAASDKKTDGRMHTIGPAGKLRSDLAALASFDFSVFQEGHLAASESGSDRRPAWARKREDEEHFTAGLDDADMGMDMDESPAGGGSTAADSSNHLLRMREVERDGEEEVRRGDRAPLAAFLEQEDGEEEEEQGEEDEIEDF